jgi:hypothetical protein
VVRPGVEDRVEVDRIDAEGREVVELLVHALEVAAVVVAAARLLLRRAVGGRRRVEAPRAVRRAVRVVAAEALGLDTPGEAQDDTLTKSSVSR